jgi:hypothetical protein
MRRSKADVRDLLQKAADKGLSEVESLRLQAYEATDEGLAYREVHTYLQQEMPQRLPEFRMNRHKLKGIAAHIDGQVQRKRRVQRGVYTVRSVAMATAVLLILFLGYNWLITDNFIPEPAAAPTSIAVPTTPTAALAPRMKYANLETAVPELLTQLPPVQYAYTLPATAAKAGFDLLIPTQLDSDMTFVGSTVNAKQNAAEIVLRNSLKVAKMHRLWFLIQSPLYEPRPNQGIPLSYQVPWSMENARKVPIEARTIAMGSGESIYEGYDLMYTEGRYSGMGEVISVRMLSWQADDRQFTLAVVSPNPISADSMKQTIEKWQLAPYVP